MSNFGAMGDGSIKGKIDKIGKVDNFGAVVDGSIKGNVGKIVKWVILVLWAMAAKG